MNKSEGGCILVPQEGPGPPPIPLGAIHVIGPSWKMLNHAGQKYTISSPSVRGMSIDYKSVFRLAISRTVLEKWAKKSENREIWANFDPRKFFFGGWEPPKF